MGDKWKTYAVDKLGAYLEHGKQALPEGVEVVSRLIGQGVKVELAAEYLHTQKREDHDEEEE